MNLLAAFLVAFAPATPLNPPPTPSMGVWGADGHKLICEIAWRHLTPEAKTFVNGIRTGEPGTFADSCTWADDVRPNRPETSAWHFINIKAGTSGADLHRDCGDPAKRCVVWAIKNFTELLVKPGATKAEQAEALKFVGHFVGDLHQPLHAGRLEDLGGNNIRLSFFGDAGTERSAMNLHRVWDSMLPRRMNLVFPASVDALMADLTSAKAAQWANSDVMAWTNESYRIDEDFVYSVANGGQIDQSYFDRAAPIVKERLQQAGVRLAFLLNEAARGRAYFTF